MRLPGQLAEQLREGVVRLAPRRKRGSLIAQNSQAQFVTGKSVNREGLSRLLLDEPFHDWMNS